MDIGTLHSFLKGNTASQPEGAARNRPSAEQRSTPAPEGDVSLSLSPVSEALTQTEPPPPEWGISFKTVPPIPHTLSELKASVDEFINGVRERINKLFADVGIELEQAVTLEANGEQGFRINAAESQQAVIEQALNGDKQLAEELDGLQQRHRLSQLLEAASVLGQGDDAETEHAEFNAALAQQQQSSLQVIITPANSNQAK